MAKSQNVSLNVQSDVSFKDQLTSESSHPKRRSANSLGRYLVRNGNSILFQMRAPKNIVHPNGHIVRLSLGALSLREAREIADELASRLRAISRALGRKMSDQNHSDENDADEIGTDNDLLDVNAQFYNFVLKSALYEIRRPGRAPTEDEKKGHELVRNLLSINREVEAKERGEPHSSLIANNARMMAASFGQKWLDDTNTANSIKEPQKNETNYGEDSKTLPLTLISNVAVTASTSQPPATLKHSSEKSKEAHIPAFKLDRRYSERPKSGKPLFSEIAAEYLALRESASSTANKDIKIARFRIDLFMELIGDHPVDTYTGTDLQAFIDLLKFWPAEEKERDISKTPREIIENNHDLHLRPLARKTLSEGYMAIIKTVINSGQTQHDYSTPIARAKLVYPNTARPSVAAEPLSGQKVESLLRTGVDTGYLDNAILPLLGFLTGRRLGLLVHLKGSDIREKYDGVWVAQTDGIIQLHGKWQRNPIKTEASTSFFVLHNFLKEIGFVDWAIKQGNKFLFSELIRLANPSKSASSYMARLFKKAGIKDTRNEVFHSLRGGYISESAEQQIYRRERKLQVGHQLGEDEHDQYGFKALTEKQARRIASLSFANDIDLSMYRSLDFEKMAKKKRI
ncbi:MAG: hypothetical protein LBE54_05600 [Brucellaceae bacterium]|nr:hypothetical protein [Brucellaceae bacterium]